MVQTLDIISVNIWQILISLINLLIMYLILKKFLFGPVQKIIATRKQQVEDIYTEAQEKRESADADFYTRKEALKKLSEGYIVIFGGGTANPFFSTDTAAALRGAELGTNLILMAKNGVDGVYDSDPRFNKDAKRFTKLSHQDVLDRNLGVMDLTAATICAQNDIDIYVFDMNKKGNISKATSDFSFGTLITNKK